MNPQFISENINRVSGRDALLGDLETAMRGRAVELGQKYGKRTTCPKCLFVSLTTLDMHHIMCPEMITQ